MKRIIGSVISVMLLLVLVLGAVPAMAAKPVAVQYQSNGFPSGHHFNLNLHGRDPSTYTGNPTGKAVIVVEAVDDVETLRPADQPCVLGLEGVVSTMVIDVGVGITGIPSYLSHVGDTV